MINQDEESLQLWWNEFLRMKRSSSELVLVMFLGNWAHNVRIFGSEHPQLTRKLLRDSPKRIIGLFFLNKTSIIGNVYIDLLTEYVAPQRDDLQPTNVFQQDGALPHWELRVRGFQNQTWTDSLVTSFTRNHSLGLYASFCGTIIKISWIRQEYET